MDLSGAVENVGEFRKKNVTRTTMLDTQGHAGRKNETK